VSDAASTQKLASIRKMTEPLLAFKAGRAFRREGTNFVDPSPTRGVIALSAGEDGLLHFIWKNRVTGESEEDLILFPSDATFAKVPQSTRTYVLKFSSSNQRHFFWMQDASSQRDEEFVRNTNNLLEDPEHALVWSSASDEGSTSQSQVSTSSLQAVGAAESEPTAEQMAQLQALVASMSRNAAPAPPELSLADVLTPANLSPLFSSHPALIAALFPHLPPDLPIPPSAEALQRIINSPQFRSAVQNFDQALRTGMLGGLVRGLGLSDEAGTGVEPFLRAVQEQARRGQGEDGDDSMEMD